MKKIFATLSIVFGLTLAVPAQTTKASKSLTPKPITKETPASDVKTDKVKTTDTPAKDKIVKSADETTPFSAETASRPKDEAETEKADVEKPVSDVKPTKVVSTEKAVKPTKTKNQFLIVYNKKNTGYAGVFFMLTGNDHIYSNSSSLFFGLRLSSHLKPFSSILSSGI